MRLRIGTPALAFWGTVALLTLTLSAQALVERRTPDSLLLPLESLPSKLAGLQLEQTETLPDQVLRVLAPTSYLLRDYGDKNGSAQVFVAYYALQRAGETMHSPKACLPGSGWDFAKRAVVPIESRGHTVFVNQDRIQNAGRVMWLVYWYQSGSRIIADEYLGKVLLVRDAVFLGKTSGAFARITVPEGSGAAERSLVMAKELMPELEKCFRK